MSNATRKGTQSPALQVADSHDLIRVHGARVNNLKDISIEIPQGASSPSSRRGPTPYSQAPREDPVMKTGTV